MAAKSKQKTIANSKNNGGRMLSGPRHRSITEVTEPETGSSSTSINEIKPGNSSAGEACKFGDRPPIQGSACEYTSLMAACKTRKAGPRYGTLRYTAEDASSGDNDSCCSASDEMSSTSCGSSGVGANKMSWRQVLVLVMVLLNAFASSLTVCLFPPFYPRLAEMKGTTATSYGLIIGTSCLVAFIVTPFIGKHLPLIGVKFSFCFGTFAGGVCCALSGLLEFFEPGQSFIIFSVLTRVLHAFANALVITSTFAYQAMEFPSSVAKVFSVTRCVMNVTQLFGPVVGGVLHEAAGFYLPFVVMGGLQVILAFFSIFLMPPPYYSEENADYNHNKKKAKLSILGILKIPTIWFSFGAFIIATMCNGFISVNLEPEVLRQFQLSPIYIGLVFGLKDGANSIASPVWGFICDSQKKSVKPYLIGSSLLVALSFFLLGGSQWFGIMISLTLPIVVVALCVNGVGIGGQQVVGVVDALHEASRAGYPDDPATQGLVAGMWSSLSGAGRFVSRAGSGILTDLYGFPKVAFIACSLQLLVAVATSLYLFCCECSLANREPEAGGLRWEDVTVVEQGSRREDKVVFSSSCSPSAALMSHSVSVDVPRVPSRVAPRIANSMPPRRVSFRESEISRSIQ